MNLSKCSNWERVGGVYLNWLRLPEVNISNYFCRSKWLYPPIFTHWTWSPYFIGDSSNLHILSETPRQETPWTCIFYRRLLDKRLLEPAPAANLHLLLFLLVYVILRCPPTLTHQTLKSLFHWKLLNKRLLEPAPGKPPTANKPVLVVCYLPMTTISET